MKKICKNCKYAKKCPDEWGNDNIFYCCKKLENEIEMATGIFNAYGYGTYEGEQIHANNIEVDKNFGCVLFESREIKK